MTPQTPDDDPRRPVADDVAAVEPRFSDFPAWPFAVLAVPIIARFIVLAAAIVAADWTASPSRIIPPWAQILQASCFASIATGLLTYGRRDRRAWVLGLFILDAAGTLLTPFLRSVVSPHILLTSALTLPSDAFQAALVWYFASVFPHPSRRLGLARFFYAGTALAFLLGGTLFAAEVYARTADPAASPVLAGVATLLMRGRRWYFTLQFLSLIPLIAAVPIKFRESGPNDRRRVMVLAAGLALGYLPLVIDTLLVTFIPSFGPPDPPFLRLRGGIIVLALTFVPVSAAYAALVQRTLDVSLIVRKALQYVLAQSVLWAAAAGPFIALLVVIALNRERSVIDLMRGPLGVMLGALTAAGVAAAFSRHRLLAVLDRRFFRQHADAQTMLVEVTRASRSATSLEAIQETLTRAVESMFHPTAIVIAIEGGDDSLHALTHELPPLARGSALALLLAGKNTPLDLVAPGHAIRDRLSAADRQWLDASQAVVLLPLLGAQQELAGVVGLWEKKSELPYRADDYELLAAVGAPIGIALERVLREARAPVPAIEALPVEAASECLTCGLIQDVGRTVCTCGGLLQRALVPRVLEDRLRFDSRIGQGGMGVVYLAKDLRLDAARAVKTLPRADPALVAGMRREARSMSAARHPNLATLHGLEIWRGVPMLVMEYLDAGTLSVRLKSGPLPISETLTLGAQLAEALATLHARSVLHLDIKPSNIGFTLDGVPKLLDFGLAKLVPRVAGPTSTTEPELEALTLYDQGSSEGARLHGTPAYLSPELLRGASPSSRDDLWSLAVTMLEACVGKNPFRAPTVTATVSRVLADDRPAQAVSRALPDGARLLFGDLLGPFATRPKTAREFLERIRATQSTGGDR